MTENKQKESLFNSRFETSLRVLLLLAEATVWPLSASTISNIDFMAVYGFEFGVSDYDLHGQNRYKFSQLTAKKLLVEEAIKKLVRLGFIAVDFDKGYRYMITDDGARFIEEMDDTYSSQYREIVRSIFKKYDVSKPSSLDEALKAARAKRTEE